MSHTCVKFKGQPVTVFSSLTYWDLGIELMCSLLAAPLSQLNGPIASMFMLVLYNLQLSTSPNAGPYRLFNYDLKLIMLSVILPN